MRVVNVKNVELKKTMYRYFCLVFDIFTIIFIIVFPYFG